MAPGDERQQVKGSVVRDLATAPQARGRNARGKTLYFFTKRNAMVPDVGLEAPIVQPHYASSFSSFFFAKISLHFFAAPFFNSRTSFPFVSSAYLAATHHHFSLPDSTS